MARSSLVAIIDFGSMSINVMIGSKGTNNTFNIKGKSEVEYSGFMEGEFLRPNELITVVGHAIEIAQLEAGTKITSLYVGVPGEFVSVVVKEYEDVFATTRRVVAEDVERMYEQGLKIKTNDAYTLINRSPIYFTLSDGRMFINPMDQKTNGLQSKLSFCFASTYFVNIIRNVLLHFNIKKVEFISQSLYQGLYLTSEEERDRFVLLCDIGYITSSVMLLGGEGLIFIKSFSTGGGNITADISEKFGIPFDVAEKVKRGISLTFRHSEDATYQVENKGKTYTLPARQVNEVVELRIEQIAEMVRKCIDLCTEDFPEYSPMYLTGGGILYTRGAKEHFARCLEMPCERAVPKNIQYDEPKMTSTYAVLETALNDIKNNSIMKKLLK